MSCHVMACQVRSGHVVPCHMTCHHDQLARCERGRRADHHGWQHELHRDLKSVTPHCRISMACQVWSGHVVPCHMTCHHDQLAHCERGLRSVHRGWQHELHRDLIKSHHCHISCARMASNALLMEATLTRAALEWRAMLSLWRPHIYPELR